MKKVDTPTDSEFDRHLSCLGTNCKISSFADDLRNRITICIFARNIFSRRLFGSRVTILALRLLYRFSPVFPEMCKLKPCVLPFGLECEKNSTKSENQLQIEASNVKTKGEKVLPNDEALRLGPTPEILCTQPARKAIKSILLVPQ